MEILNLGFWIVDCMHRTQAGAKRSAAPGPPKSRIQNPKPQILLGLALFLLFCSPAFSQRQAQLPWWDRAAERMIGPYWIKSDLPAEDVNSIGRHLNIMRREYDRVLSGVPIRVQEKLNVLIFKTRDEAMLTLRTRFAVASASEGGFLVSPNEHVLGVWTEGRSPRDIERLIQREGFRQYAYNRFAEDMPVWLELGLAELFGEAILVGDALVFGQSTPRMCQQVQDAIAAGKHIPLSTFLPMTAEEWKAASKDDAVPLLRQARSMTLFAMQNSPAFAKYIRHLNNGLPAKHAFARSFGDIAPFEEQWKAFAQSMRPGSLITALERIEFLAEGAAELGRRGMQPQSLESLKTMLRQIGFNYTMKSHGEEFEISSADDWPFEIPKDELCAQQPAFVLGKARAGPNSPPPPFNTQSLRPTGVQVKWNWDKDKKAFVHQILIR